MEQIIMNEPQTELRPKLQLTHAPSVLIVEDDVTMAPLLEFIVEQVHPSAHLVWATTEEAAETAINNRLRNGSTFDIVISDVFLSGRRTGIDLWQRYSEHGINFLLISAVSQSKLHQMIGPNERTPLFMQKPLNPDLCITTLRVMLDRD